MESVSETVSKYLEIRNERDALLKAYEAKDAVLKEKLEECRVVLLNACNSIDANSINTSSGTVIRKLNERYYCTDWESFKDFVRENDALECLERRIHQKNFKQLLDELGGEIPVSVNVMREFDVSVRKPSSNVGE